MGQRVSTEEVQGDFEDGLPFGAYSKTQTGRIAPGIGNVGLPRSNPAIQVQRGIADRGGGMNRLPSKNQSHDVRGEAKSVLFRRGQIPIREQLEDARMEAAVEAQIENSQLRKQRHIAR